MIYLSLIFVDVHSFFLAFWFCHDYYGCENTKALFYVTFDFVLIKKKRKGNLPTLFRIGFLIYVVRVIKIIGDIIIHISQLSVSSVCVYFRLNRGYKPADMYLSIFMSPLMAIVAK